MPSTSNEQCELEHWDEDTEEQAESVELTAMENGTFHDLNEEPSICYDSADEDDGADNQGLQITNVSSLSTTDEYQPLEKSSSKLQNVSSRNDTTIATTPEFKEQLQKEHHRNSSDKFQQSSKQLATKLCKNIATILGETDDVFCLDKSREDQKCHPTSHVYNKKYQNLFSGMKTKILTKRISLKKEHNTWDREYCLNNDFLEPSLTDVKKDKKQYCLTRKHKHFHKIRLSIHYLSTIKNCPLIKFSC